MATEIEQPQEGGQQEYTRAQFEHAFRSVTQMLHAVSYLNLPEIQRWVMLVTDSDSLGVELTQKQLDGRANVLRLLDNLQAFKETLSETGIPPVPPMQVQPGDQHTPNSELPSARRQ